jgi:predicted transposase YbfD/YdcC
MIRIFAFHVKASPPRARKIKVAKKSNEIVAIPKLLDLLAVKSAIVRIDAIGYQRNNDCLGGVPMEAPRSQCSRPLTSHLWPCVAGGRPRLRATISRPASQMN